MYFCKYYQPGIGKAKLWYSGIALALALSVPASAQPLTGSSVGSLNTSSPTVVSEGQALPTLERAAQPSALQPGLLPEAVGPLKSLQVLENEQMQLFEAVAESKELHLQDAERAALLGSHKLKASEFSVREAHEQLGQWLSNIYPTVSASANLTHSGTLNSRSSSYIANPDSGTPVTVNGGSASNATTRLNANLTVSQKLLDFARKPRLRQAELQEMQALASWEATRQDVLQNVRKAWFVCYIDQVIVDIDQQSLNNKRERLAQAQGLYKGGTKARIDVATAEADVAQAHSLLIHDTTQLHVDSVALNAAMGLPQTAAYRLQPDPYWETIPEASLEELVKAAYASRPELQSLQMQLRSQLANLDIISAGRYPSLSASGSIGGSGNITPFEGTWSIGLSASWTIFDGFLTRYEESAAKVKCRTIGEQFFDERLTVYQEVATGLVVVQQARASIDTSLTALAKAKESYRLAAARYKVGVGNSVEVSDAELSLAQAQVSLAQALNDLRLAKVQLTRAVGVEDLHNLPKEASEITLDKMPDLPAPFVNRPQETVSPAESVPSDSQEQ